MMDNMTLSNEYDAISTTSAQSLETVRYFNYIIQLSNLHSYYKTVFKYGQLFFLNTKQSIEEFFEQQVKIDTKSSMSKSLFEFYRYYEDFTIQTSIVLSKLNNDILDPMEIFHHNLTTSYTEILDDYKTLANVINDTKRNLEKMKIKYYESSIHVQEMEKNLMETFSGKLSNEESDAMTDHDNLLKLRSQAENFAQLYRYEITKANKIFEENETKYQNIIQRLKMNEESKVSFIKRSMEKFLKFYEEFSIKSQEFISKLNSASVEIKSEEDIKIFNEKWTKFMTNTNTNTNNIRFPKEEFISFDAYIKKTNTDAMSSDLGTFTLTSKDNLINPTLSPTKINYETNEIIPGFLDEFEIVNENQIYSEEYQNSLIKDFLKQLLSDLEIDADIMIKLMEGINNSRHFSKKLIDGILKDRKHFFIKLLSLSNMQHLANIFSTISLNIDNVSSVSYDLNFAIIFIAERIYYQEDEQVVFLCALMSKNKIYMTKSFWIDLIELKLARKMEEHIDRLEKIEIIPQQSDLHKDSGSSFSSGDLGLGIFSAIGSTIKNIFNKNTSIKDSLLVSSMKTVKLIKNLDNLEEHKYPILDKITSNEASGIIREFILHMTNFNYETSEEIDLVVELSTKYKISKTKINYFVTYLHSSSYSIRKNLPGRKAQSYLNKNIESNRKSRSRFLSGRGSFMLNQRRSSINTPSVFSEEKLKVLSLASVFLKGSDHLSLMSLNRPFGKRLSQKIYKMYLMKDNLGRKERLEIWKSILKTKELMINVNYHDTVKLIPDKKQSDAKIPDLIDLDVQRTFFDSNIEESRTAITSILKALSLVNPRIDYCQGMNYIVSFLYQISKNEEETFYIMLGLFQNTEFSLIFMEDLQKLKVCFYVFERLLSLFVPELSSFFKSNGVVVNYFCSPWFITLFTNSCPFMACNNEQSKILMKIWDEFLLSGWKSLMKAGLALMKTYEQELVKMKYEDMLHFLINDIIKSNFFNSNKYENYLSLCRMLKVKSKLISNIENELNQENRIREIEENQKLQVEK